MAEIHLVFPVGGDPIAINDTKPVLDGEFITWHIHTPARSNPPTPNPVTKVKIGFQDADALFFPTATGLKNELPKPLEKGRAIWGVAPQPQSQGRRRWKYTVWAYDAKGDDVGLLDPTIISDKP
ncbi:MAG: hypothetical protein HY510_06365 [Acidobacteria bacterium]|nr:hypothetical protein [Acidobacteriota bacterium]